MSTAAANPNKATQFGQYMGLLLVALFVAAGWTLIAILLTPLGGDAEIMAFTLRMRWYLIFLGFGLDAMVSVFGCFAVYAGRTARRDQPSIE